MVPQIRYTKTGDVSIAYQVFGQGPLDLVIIPGWVSNIEIFWEQPDVVRFFTRLAAFARVILFDKRGTGLSDRVAQMPNLETRMDDVRVVLDAVRSEHAALFGYSEGGVLCALFAATYPDRTTGLIMHASYARLTWRPDYPWGDTDEERLAFIDDAVRNWGAPIGIESRAPSMAHDERFRQWWARFLRLSASPSAFATLARMNAQIDIRHILPVIRVPTLILHSVNDQALPIGGSQYLAEHIPNAKLVELIGPDHVPVPDGCGRGGRRSRRTPDWCPARFRTQPSTRHGLIHRHRWFERARCELGRSSLAGTAGRPPYLSEA